MGLYNTAEELWDMAWIAEKRGIGALGKYRAEHGMLREVCRCIADSGISGTVESCIFTYLASRKFTVEQMVENDLICKVMNRILNGGNIKEIRKVIEKRIKNAA